MTHKFYVIKIKELIISWCRDPVRSVLSLDLRPRRIVTFISYYFIEHVMCIYVALLRLSMCFWNVICFLSFRSFHFVITVQIIKQIFNVNQLYTSIKNKINHYSCKNYELLNCKEKIYNIMNSTTYLLNAARLS